MQGLMYLCLEKEDKPQGNYTHPHPQKNIMHDLDKQINQRLEDLAKKENLRHLSLPYSSLGKWIVVNEEKRLNLSGNDYLGLAERDDLREQFAALHPNYSSPSGSTSSRLLLGNYEEAALFEEEIAKALEHPAALLFNSGYHLNTGILPALAHLEGVKVYADRMVHASIIDGIRLSRLPFTRFRHNDLEHLTELLKEDEGKYRISIVAVESLYSMDGDEADLKALVALKKKYPSLVIYCDEAHAIGTHGANGYGLAEEHGVLADIDILVGTFGKALNSMGAYAAISTSLREYLINMAPPPYFLYHATTSRYSLEPIHIRIIAPIRRRACSIEASKPISPFVSPRKRILLPRSGSDLAPNYRRKWGLRSFGREATKGRI